MQSVHGHLLGEKEIVGGHRGRVAAQGQVADVRVAEEGPLTSLPMLRCMSLRK